MTGVSDPRPQDLGSWVWSKVSLDRGSEQSRVPCLLGFGSGGKCCVPLGNPAPAQMLCAGFPGQGTPPDSFGPNWAHEP